MNTCERGQVCEAVVLGRFVSAGFRVLVPFGEGHPYDLAVEISGANFARVQCKAGWLSNGCVVFNARSTDHGSGAGNYDGRADLLASYVVELEDVFLIPVVEAPRSRVHLRVGCARNNQRSGVRDADHYRFDAWNHGRLGASVSGEAGARDCGG